MACLRALQALLDVPWPRWRIGSDQVLDCALGRPLLTSETTTTFGLSRDAAVYYKELL